jgi:hypothetical protein
MTKKTLFIIVFALLSVLLALPSLAEMTEREKKSSSQADMIDRLGIPSQYELERFADEGEFLRRDDEVVRRLRPTLGVAVTAGNGVGEVIDNTWNDLQRWVNQGRNVEHSYVADGGLVDVHFIYDDFADSTGRTDTNVFEDPSKTGYNVWNANDSTWPWGQEAGCLVQSGDSVFSTDSHLDIMPNGLVVICARDNFSAASQAGGWRDEDGYVAYDNHFYWQEARHNCFYDTGGTGSNSNIVPPSMYQPGTLNGDTGTTNNPITGLILSPMLASRSFLF